MIPEKTSSKWKTVVLDGPLPDLNSLATKMMIMRVRLMTRNDSSPEKISAAIDEAHDFFVKNADATVKDQQILFG